MQQGEKYGADVAVYADRLRGDLCRILIREAEDSGGNAAEGNAFQPVGCRQFQTGAIAGRQQLPVLLGHSSGDDGADRVQDIPAGQIE